MLEALTSLFSSTAQGCTLCCTVDSASNFHELDVEAAVMCFNFMMCRGSFAGSRMQIKVAKSAKWFWDSLEQEIVEAENALEIS